MNYRVEFTDQANTEADAAYSWIAIDAPDNAFIWFEGLIDAIDTLRSFPERCVVAPESEELGQEIRQLLYGKYRLLFTIVEQTVFVLHVRHGAREYLSKEEF